MDYFISKCPDAERILNWAEDKGAQPIDLETVDVHCPNMGEIQASILSHHVWGFLHLCLTGTAKQKFRSTPRRNGLDIWRQLVTEINSRTDVRRHGLRNAVQEPVRAAHIGQVMKAVADWETAYNTYREAGGPEMPFEERKNKFLKILPTALRRDLFRRLTDFGSVYEMKEWVRVQAEMEKQWEVEDRRQGVRPRPAGVHVVEEPLDDEHLELPSEDDMEALMALAPGASQAELLAIQKRFMKYRNGAAQRRFPRRTGETRAGPGGSRPARTLPTRLPGAPGDREPKCVNCGSTAHMAAKCDKAALEPHKRPCFKCGRPGHRAANCRSAQANALIPTDDGAAFIMESVYLGCLEKDPNEWRTINRGASAKVESRPHPTLANFLSRDHFAKLGLYDDDDDNDYETERVTTTTSITTNPPLAPL